jgi:hypothetical protein
LEALQDDKLYLVDMGELQGYISESIAKMFAQLAPGRATGGAEGCVQPEVQQPKYFHSSTV